MSTQENAEVASGFSGLVQRAGRAQQGVYAALHSMLYADPLLRAPGRAGSAGTPDLILKSIFFLYTHSELRLLSGICEPIEVASCAAYATAVVCASVERPSVVN